MRVKRIKLDTPQTITNGRETVQIIEAETVDGELRGFVVEGGSLPKPRYFPSEFLARLGFKVPTTIKETE